MFVPIHIAFERLQAGLADLRTGAVEGIGTKHYDFFVVTQEGAYYVSLLSAIPVAKITLRGKEIFDKYSSV